MTNLEKHLNAVMEHITMFDELPGMSEEDIKEAFCQYLHHSMIQIELAEQIEIHNEWSLDAIDYCEYILTRMEEDKLYQVG